MEHTSVQEIAGQSYYRAPVMRLEDLVIESFHDGVLVLDFQMRVTATNSMMESMVPANWTGEYPCALETVFPAPADEFEWLQQMLRDRMCVHNHVFSFLRNGKPCTLLADSYLLSDEAGEPVGICLFLKDIGTILSLEKKVQHNEKLATVGKIAAGVAHEIRNPLTSIKGFLQMMRHELERNGMQKEQNYTTVMLSEIEHINELVSELLLLSKPRELRMEPISIEELLGAMKPLISSEATLKNVEFHLLLESAPPVLADRELLKQVFFNLVKNAIDAMEETGGGRLMIRMRHEEDEQVLRVDVQDTGPGIPHYLMDRIFDAFYTTKETGTGLGLPICQRLINDVGGKLKVASKGYGTTFSVLLPTGKSST